jgi:hypothetical protein
MDVNDTDRLGLRDGTYSITTGEMNDEDTDKNVARGSNQNKQTQEITGKNTHRGRMHYKLSIENNCSKVLSFESIKSNSPL